MVVSSPSVPESKVNPSSCVCKSQADSNQSANVCSPVEPPQDKGGKSSQDETSEFTNNSIFKCGRTFTIPQGANVEDYQMFYIGREGLTLTNLMMTFNKCSFCSYNPETKVARKESVNVNKALMKRYYMIERAKDARIVGIVVGTLGRG